MDAKPAIAQLVEHLTVESCSNQMVPGSIPGGRIFLASCELCYAMLCCDIYIMLCYVMLGYDRLGGGACGLPVMH
jgi:hypothetical protein